MLLGSNLLMDDFFAVTRRYARLYSVSYNLALGFSWVSNVSGLARTQSEVDGWTRCKIEMYSVIVASCATSPKTCVVYSVEHYGKVCVYAIYDNRLRYYPPLIKSNRKRRQVEQS